MHIYDNILLNFIYNEKYFGQKCTFMIISYLILFRMRNILDKNAHL